MTEAQMTYWQNDADFLRELADAMENDLPNWRERINRLRDIAHDLSRTAPDSAFLEELAGKIERWSDEGVCPTRAYAETIAQELRSTALGLKKEPSQ